MTEKTFPSASSRPRPGVPVEKAGGECCPESIRLVSRVLSLVSRSDDPAVIVDGFLADLGRLLSARGWLAGWDPRAGRACWIHEQEGPIPLHLVGVPGSLLGNALLNSHPAVVHDIGALPDVPEKPYLARSGGAWAFLPVVNAGQTLACLILRGSGAHILSRQSLEPVREALPIVALSLKASRLQAELQAGVDERTGELSALYEVSRSLGFVLAVEDLFQLVCEALRRSVHCDLCAFTLYMPGRREMSIRAGPAAGEAAVRAFSRDVLKHLGKPAGRGPGEVAVHVSRTDPSDAEPPEAGAQPLRSTVHAPLQLRGEIVGQLSMGSCGAGKFTATNRRLLQTIASQAALTLDRLRTAREAETSRIHSMLESMAEGVLLLDRDLKIMMLNPAAEAHLTAITGASPGPALESLGEIDMRSMIRDRQEPGSRTRPFEVEDSSGTRAFSVTCSPVRDASASVDGMVVVISDITEARRLQAHLAQSEKLSALGEMISGVAHELNNPLASVMGNAELLQEQEASESVRRKVLAIRKEAQRCRKIVSNLLHFSRGHAPEHGPVDINAGIQAVLQLLEHQLKVDSVKVDVDLEQALNAVMGDSHLLQQVFLNIVFNAYQAMQEKVGPGRLTIRSRNGRHRVVVEISDNGPGIPPAILKKIFDPFFSTKEVGRGTGLGLSLAYGTVRQHGGTLRAESRPGEGSTFVVELPFAPAGVTQREPEADAAARPSPFVSVPAGATPGSSGRKILIVEDEAPLAEVVAEVLQMNGHAVDTAVDGRTAKARIAAVDYDVIISDLKMPNMNGMELYRHVHAVDPDLARRIIFSTGDSVNPDTLAFFEEVGNRHLTKPFDLAELVNTVNGVLRES